MGFFLFFNVFIPGSALYRSFDECDGLRYVIIPRGVRVIPYEAFFGCDNLKYVYIPDSVRYIEDDAFAGCPSLKTIEIPDSCEYAGGFCGTVPPGGTILFS